jgi:integrase/recombinase XerD
VTPLRQRMLEDFQIRHYSPTTIRLYLYAVREFAKYFGRPPDQLGAEHIRRYQLFLTKEKKVSTSSYVLMVCALRFFYTILCTGRSPSNAFRFRGANASCH